MELWVGKPFGLEGSVSGGSGPADMVARYSRAGLFLYSCDPKGLELLHITVRKLHPVKLFQAECRPLPFHSLWRYSAAVVHLSENVPRKIPCVVPPNRLYFLILQVFLYGVLWCPHVL